jgi:hypothetical protein
MYHILPIVDNARFLILHTLLCDTPVKNNLGVRSGDLGGLSCMLCMAPYYCEKFLWRNK